MTLRQEDKDTLVMYRLQRANETMAEVKGTMQLGYWRLAANRLYYACYYAACALLIKNDIIAHTHSGVLNQLGLHFVAKEIINKEQNKLIKHLFELRQDGDYSDWSYIDEKDIKPLIEPAENFIKSIEQLILNL